MSNLFKLARDSPDLPRYDRIPTTGQRWRDLIGYYTRYGEIRELLTAVDDRYVIMNAGDEMRFRFAAPPAALEDGPVSRRHRGRREPFNTRYVTRRYVADELVVGEEAGR